jgi:hypothetical protein
MGNREEGDDFYHEALLKAVPVAVPAGTGH